MKLLKDRGYQLIYTPTYTPTVQPIEMVWAYVKNYVARQYENGTAQKSDVWKASMGIEIGNTKE